MLAGIKKRLARRHTEIKESEDDDKDDLHAFARPANFIKINQGRIQFAQPPTTPENDTNPIDVPNKKDKEVLESRIVELEEALLRLQEKVNNSQCGSPRFETELREQLESMSRVMKSKDRKQMQTCRDHKALQTRFARQENLLHAMQHENKGLQLRIRQYERCLDDVMRKVVDAIVAEDNLREEVTLLKSRVRDLEAQNAALSISPAKGRDEGYCTMSSGQPQPSNGHLEDLPEEPEHWLLPGEPCSTEMEDWSMSQEELAVITLDDDRETQHLQTLQQQLQQYRQATQTNKSKVGEHDWIWNSNDFLASTIVEADSISDGISQLLQQKIVYSEDEEIACTEFTNDFYKLVNIRSNSAHSRYSYIEDDDTDDEDDDDDEDDEDSSLSDSEIPSGNTNSKVKQLRSSPTPSEAGRAQVTSCSSSESDELSRCTTHRELHTFNEEEKTLEINETLNGQQTISLDDADEIQLNDEQCLQLAKTQCIEEIIKRELRRPTPPHLLQKSKSIIDEHEPSCILRNNQRREIETSVVRSGSMNSAIAARINETRSASTSPTKLLRAPTSNSWRKSNGWKRVTSPVHTSAPVSPKKFQETKSEIPKNILLTQKLLPTRIPTSTNATTIQQQNIPNKQQSQQLPKKSKIPPPVPVRRSYAS